MNVSKKFILVALACVVLSIAISTGANAYWGTDGWETTTGAEEAAFLFGFGLTICLLIMLVPLIIAILAAIWIYKDAEKRGKSGVLWVILLIVMTLLLNLIGFIIIIIVWLAVRPPIGGDPNKQTVTTGTSRQCPSCGRPIPMDAQVCPYCGKDFRPPVQ
jgi:Na+/H+-dicarboxylate symporter